MDGMDVGDGDGERAFDSSVAGGAVRGFLKGASKAARASRYDASLQKSAAPSIPKVAIA